MEYLIQKINYLVCEIKSINYSSNNSTLIFLKLNMDNPFEVRSEGLFCKPGGFYVDACAPVPLCIVTHAHGDHARPGHQHYLCAQDSLEILQLRLGKENPIRTVSYQEKIKLGSCWVSLHPAGHILGSAQIRIETTKGVFVVSGDYKRAEDATCEPFEPIACDQFVTESTFALPIYKWESNEMLAKRIFDWWQNNALEKHPSVLFCYALGKAQRILSLLRNLTDQTIYLHGAMLPITEIYAQKGILLASYASIIENVSKDFSKALILAPPSAAGSLWLKRFPNFRTAFASGWAQVRGVRRRKKMDNGFVISDHADWQALIRTIEETQAKEVLTTHGNAQTLAKFLREEKSIYSRDLKGLESTEEGED